MLLIDSAKTATISVEDNVDPVKYIFCILHKNKLNIQCLYEHNNISSTHMDIGEQHAGFRDHSAAITATASALPLSSELMSPCYFSIT